MTSRSVAEAFLRLCESLDTPRSLACFLMFLHNEDEQLAKLDFKPTDYLDQRDLLRIRDDYLATEYLSKYKGLDTRIDTISVAFDSFIAAEESCRLANLRIRSLTERATEVAPWVLDVLARAQEKIFSCIGYGPKWSKLQNRFRWGPGATFSLGGVNVRLDEKLLEKEISVTAEALPLLRAAMATDYAWLRARGIEPDGPTSLIHSEFRVVPGAKVVCVDKNAKTGRIINIEPSGNVFLQLGVGSYLRHCLHRVGINLDDQTINQGLARLALDLGLATVDLKAASDTICSALVWLLLPFNWASLLSRLRSPSCKIKGEWLPLEKFSSMGNGFTFELETLIFWSLTESLRDHMGETGRVSVYGDDIICPTAIVGKLYDLFGVVGFTVNRKKTHDSGYFRESCGKHYFAGRDITPIYQKEVPNAPDEIFRFHNRLVYHALDRGSFVGTQGLADCKFRWIGSVRASLDWAVRTWFSAREERAKQKGKKARPVKVSLLQLPIVSDVSARSFDGGFVTCVRSLHYKFQLSSRPISTLTWVFKPRELPSHEYAIYAATCRPRPKVEGEITYVQRMDKKLGFREQSLPFTGEITARRLGNFVLRRSRFSEGCELRWVS